MSDLLNKASLVMIPSGYKEDTVYSVVPSDGSGDLALTRASNGTRINSAGLVEVVPWNLLTYSEDLTNAVWNKANASGTAPVVTANDTTAPNGTLTADKIVFSSGVGSSINGVFNYLNGGGAGINGLRTASVYLKSSSGTPTIYLTTQDDGTGGNYTTCVLSTEWQRFEVSYTTAAVSAQSLLIGYYPGAGSPSGPSSSLTVYAWGAQINYGELKPYFPTTDRLNVPRLTYQNGGGGCPSLLLEKQSTNLLTYSEQFDNAAWVKLDSGSGSTTPIVTANYAISPDGTQNADRLQCTLGSSGYSLIQQQILASGTHTGSIWVKSNTSANQNIYFRISQNTTAFVVTPQWQRITLTEINGDYLTIGLRNQTGYTNYSCDILIWGAQLEASSYVTSYINTTSASATRVADACYKTGISSLIGQSEGVLFLDFVATTEQTFFTISNSASPSSNNIYIQAAIGDVWRAYVLVGGTYQVAITAGTGPSGRCKIAFAYKQNDFALYANGALILADTSGTVPTCDNLNFGYINNTYQPLQTNQAVLFKTRLSNSELIALTTI